jgi:hypothetical protein
MLLAQHTALRRVGRRVAPESVSEMLSARNDGSSVFQQPVNIRANPRDPRLKICISAY